MISVTISYTQSNLCFNKDSNLCYISDVVPKSKLLFEKKLESQDLVLDTHTPLLADLDGDCIPEIIAQGPESDYLLIISSLTGSLKAKINTYILYPFYNSFCVADIDNDGVSEIFVIAANFFTNPINIRSRLICYGTDGTIKWISDQRVDRDYNNKITDIMGSPAIADFNQDGIPEIYMSNKIFNALTGVKLADGGPNGVGTETSSGFFYGPVTTASQLDMDTSDLELAAGYTIYKVKILNPNGLLGNSMTPMNIKVNNEFNDGATSIGDINTDGQLDVIVTTPGLNGTGLIYVYALINGMPRLIAKANPPSLETNIGPPLIGDIKGIRKPSILFARASVLFSYSYNGTGLLQQDWNLSTTDSSGSNGLTIFDFNNDGINEIVYRDMTSLKIIDGSGALPKIIGQADCFAHTYNENPIIGGFNSMQHAMICVPCLSNSGQTSGRITLFGPPDTLPGWAPARGIWNQYNYHVLNVNDDLTIPRVQKSNATYKNGNYNNFYVQESLLEDGKYLKKAASLTGKIKCINYDPINNEYTVIFDIYNRLDASFNADSSLPVSFYNGDPATGGSIIGTYYTFKKLENRDSLLNLEFKFNVVNLTDLFMVINTTRIGSGQFDPKDFTILECDYTDNTFHTPELPKIEKLNVSICKGDSYNFYNTIIKDNGVYYHKHTTLNGCDSLISSLVLSLVDTVHATQSKITCDKYSWNGQTYKQSGSYLFDTINQFGCDSLVTLELIINNSDSTYMQHTACDSYMWNGTNYRQSGNYTYKTLNSFGCDSFLILELHINKSDSIEVRHSTCVPYKWHGQIYTQSGIYSFDTLNRFGCDSTAILDLTIHPIINATVSEVVCDSLDWNGKTYTQSGNYTYTTMNYLGCDSITTLQLTVHLSNNSDTILTACDQYTWNGQVYNQSGMYSILTQNTSGCDSVASLNLKINKSSKSVDTQVSCGSYSWNGQTYVQSGNYSFQTLNSDGCDSIASLNLIINQSDSLHIQQDACDSYSWHNQTYTQTGNYRYKTVNRYGCDSILDLDLTIYKSRFQYLSLSVCDSLNFLGETLRRDGDYTFMIKDIHGCDSTIKLNLKILSETQNNKATACDTFFWNLNGQSYSKSGIYFQKYVNSFGCDSIYQLDLTIHKNFDELQQAEACNEYLWQVNKILLNQSGEYIYPLKTIHGCDSILRLNLLINYDFAKTDTVITDSTYTWPVNHKSYPTSGVYQEYFTSGGGCDSIRNLFLIIKKNKGIYYPNVIRPGGPNGWFTIFDNGLTISSIVTLTVYDRWGDLVWQKHGILPNELQMGWDGTFNGMNVLPGVYVWHALLALKDGSMITEKGDVTVIR